MLNLNWEKIHSIILFVTCHGYRNFAPFIHIPRYPFVNFQNPMSYMTHPTPSHPFMTHPTPPLYDTPTPPLHDPPTPPHPWYIFGHKGAFFHGLLHYVSLLVDNYGGPDMIDNSLRNGVSGYLCCILTLKVFNFEPPDTCLHSCSEMAIFVDTSFIYWLSMMVESNFAQSCKIRSNRPNNCLLGSFMTLQQSEVRK